VLQRLSTSGKRRAALIAVAAILGILAAMTFSTSTGRYYVRMLHGHSELMLAREPIADLLQRPATGPELERQLTTARSIRDFASERLALPDNDSYRSYVNVGRDQLLWNVTAVPEFSLTPKEWCYPVVGCQSYRGYFTETRARSFAQGLEAKGYVTSVRPASAYSTLGIFADPLTNTMLQRDASRLAELIFHELAHQKFYIKNRIEINEAFAESIARIGLELWLESRGEDAAPIRRILALEDAFMNLILGYREKLAELYHSNRPAEIKIRHKERILKELRREYERLKQRHNGTTAGCHVISIMPSWRRSAPIAGGCRIS